MTWPIMPSIMGRPIGGAPGGAMVAFSALTAVIEPSRKPVPKVREMDSFRVNLAEGASPPSIILCTWLMYGGDLREI